MFIKNNSIKNVKIVFIEYKDFHNVRFEKLEMF